LKHTLKFVFSEDDPLSKVCSRVIRVAPTGSKASPNVRYAFDGDRLCASQRTDAMYHERSTLSFDHFIGSQHQASRDFVPNRLRGPEIDD
jgi:hypothetical protein